MGDVSSSPSPLAGEGWARSEAVGGRGVGDVYRPKESTPSEEVMLDRAKRMRSKPTEAEAKLWSILRAKRLAGYKFREQVRIDDRYIVDFICFSERLIVEADGSQHAENTYDEKRDAYLEAQGFRILRFWNNDILNNIEGVATAILAALEYPSPTASRQQAAKTSYPLPQGERNR